MFFFRNSLFAFLLLYSIGLNAQAPGLEWANAFLRPSGFGITIVESVATDAAGNVYTTGRFDGITDSGRKTQTGYLSLKR